MGFTCGLYKVKKFNNLTLPEINMIHSYYYYQENDWAKKNYATWQDYCKTEHANDYVEVKQSDIDLYKDEYIYRDNVYSKSLSICYDDWCSNGASFHEWFMEKGEKINDYESILNKDVIIAALNICSTELQGMSFKSVTIDHAFTEDSNTGVITLMPCDGVETVDSDGNIRREYTDGLDTNVYIPENGEYFEYERYDAYVRLLDALIAILATTDFDNEIVYYNGGW